MCILGQYLPQFVEIEAPVFVFVIAVGYGRLAGLLPEGVHDLPTLELLFIEFDVGLPLLLLFLIGPYKGLGKIGLHHDIAALKLLVCHLVLIDFRGHCRGHLKGILFKGILLKKLAFCHLFFSS